MGYAIFAGIRWLRLNMKMCIRQDYNKMQENQVLLQDDVILVIVFLPEVNYA